MGVGRIFFPGGANNGFYTGSQKDMCKWAAKSGEISFTHSKTKKTTFLRNICWENVKFQNPGVKAPCHLFRRPCLGGT